MEENTRLKKAVLEFLDAQESQDTQSDMEKASVSKRADYALKGNMAAENEAGASGKGLKDGVVHVQYNPSKISFTAKIKEKLTTEEERSYKVSALTDPSTLVMKVDLLFFSDDGDAKDVRERMELFFERLGYSATCNIRFSWGTFTF